MKKRTLKQRASDYVSRTLPCIDLEPWVRGWAERAWLAGYAAGRKAAQEATDGNAD